MSTAGFTLDEDFATRLSKIVPWAERLMRSGGGPGTGSSSQLLSTARLMRVVGMPKWDEAIQEVYVEVIDPSETDHGNAPRPYVYDLTETIADRDGDGTLDGTPDLEVDPESATEEETELEGVEVEGSDDDATTAADGEKSTGIFRAYIPTFSNDGRRPPGIGCCRPGVRLWVTPAKGRLYVLSEPIGAGHWFEGQASVRAYGEDPMVRNIPPYGVVAPCYSQHFDDPQWSEASGQGMADGEIKQRGTTIGSGTSKDGMTRLQCDRGSTWLGSDDMWRDFYTPGIYAVNGPFPVMSTDRKDSGGDYRGAFTFALDQPAWCLFEGRIGAWPHGPLSHWGPAPKSYKLWPGLPGFRPMTTWHELSYVTLTENRPFKSSHTAGLFIQQPAMGGSFWAYALENWTDVRAGYNADEYDEEPYVLAAACWWPQKDPGANVVIYDGRTINGVTLPTVVLKIMLPRNGTSGDPNVVAGQYLQYTIGPAHWNAPDLGLGATTRASCYAPTAAGTYLDEPIGTIRASMSISTETPRGWGKMDGVENAAANGGSGKDLATDGRFLRQTTTGVTGGVGGAASYTLGAAGSFYDELPPYLDVQFYERLDNSK